MSDVFVQIGDTVHVATPDDAPAGFAVAVAPPTVAELLAQSRAAHQRFQKAAGHNNGRGVTIAPDDDAAALAVRQALDARQSAEDTDPGHTDPAWADDQAANKGVASDVLLAFYKNYFEPDVKL